jgi:rhamnosyltransferase
MNSGTSQPLLVEHDPPARDASTPAPRIAVAIPALNGGDRLLELLDAVHNQAVGEGGLEVLLADSQSDDGSIAEARRRFPALRLFTVERSRFNHGLVRTAMVEAARAGRVALFSQDAVPVGSRYLGSMAAALDDERVAGVYARQVPRPGADPLVRATLQHWTPDPGDDAGAGALHRALPSGTLLASLPPRERMQLARFDNVGSMVRAEVVARIPFPARPFGEDLAWGASVLAAGLRLAYLPTACVEHHHDPLISETFRRNRLAHFQAREEFGLHSVPDLRHLARALVAGVPADLEKGTIWALRGLPRRGAALLGQWAGARDALRAESSPTSADPVGRN